MSGGIMTFVALTTLQASQVNNYLMDQVIIVTTSGARPASPVLGMTIFESDTSRFRRYDGTNWRLVPGPRYGRTSKTSGDYTLNSTAWANVDTGLDIALDAVVGDILEWSVTGAALSGANPAAYYFDVLLSAGSNTFSGQNGGNGGLAGLRAIAYSTAGNLSGSFFYQVQAADIASGNVNMRLRYQTGAATNCTLYADSTQGLLISAINHGPAN